MHSGTAPKTIPKRAKAVAEHGTGQVQVSALRKSVVRSGIAPKTIPKHAKAVAKHAPGQIQLSSLTDCDSQLGNVG